MTVPAHFLGREAARLALLEAPNRMLHASLVKLGRLPNSYPAYFVVAFAFPPLLRLLPGSPVPTELSRDTEHD